MEITTVYFVEAGPQNTPATLCLAHSRAQELGISQVVLATNTGQTALEAAEAFVGSGIRLTAVTLHAGRWSIYSPPDPEKVHLAKEAGVQFLTATHALAGNVERAIRDKFGGLPPVEVVAQTLYLFSQGAKVAVEVTVMAADAGLIPVDGEIIALGGTRRGADTALVLKPAFSNTFFDLRIREIICKPR